MHLFIVSEDTLPMHLEYGFAGVSRNGDCCWSNVCLAGSSDRAQASLYADACRVHAGDEILFYLERPKYDVGREGGRFFGVFEVVSDSPIYEPGGCYLLPELEKTLIYRFLIKPKEVFSEGITEWQTMDEMTDYNSLYDIPWTLIYRKMTGGRGCTPLLPHEASSLRRMLDLRNAGQRLNATSVVYDANEMKLVGANTSSLYLGATDKACGIETHLLHLMNNTPRKWELHLQAYLMQEIGRNPTLTQQFFPGVDITWIGNEIYAGAGMQSIDILVYSKSDCNTFVHLVELKSDIADASAAAQLNRYVKWLRAHIPGLSVHQIIPTLVAPDVSNDFHSDIKVYLRGHGINQYRVAKVDNQLHFDVQNYRVL